MTIFGKLNFLNSHLWILYIKADSKLILSSQETHVQGNKKDTRITPGVVLVSLLLTFNIFHTLF